MGYEKCNDEKCMNPAPTLGFSFLAWWLRETDSRFSYAPYRGIYEKDEKNKKKAHTPTSFRMQPARGGQLDHVGDGSSGDVEGWRLFGSLQADDDLGGLSGHGPEG